LAQTPLEIIESIDMMRVLENGDSINMVPIQGLSIGVDTREELLAVEKLMRDDPLMQRYL